MPTQRSELLNSQPGFQSLPERTRDWILQSPHATHDFAEFFAKGGKVEPAQSADLPYYHATQPPKIYISAKTYADLTGPDAAHHMDTELRLFATLAHEIGHDKHNPGTEPFKGKTAEEYVQYRSELEAKTVFNAFPIFDDLQKSDPEFRAKWDAIGYGRGSGLEPAGIYSEWKAGRINDATAVTHLAAPIPNFPYTRKEPLADQNGDGVLTQRDVYLLDFQRLMHRTSAPADDSRSSKPEPESRAPQHAPRADHPTHVDNAAYERIRGTVQASGRWSEEENRNISANLLQAHKADPLSQRLDKVVVGNPLANGDVHVFAVYQPWGDKEPRFLTSVNATEAAKAPADKSLDQVEQLSRQQAASLDGPGAPNRGPRMG